MKKPRVLSERDLCCPSCGVWYVLGPWKDGLAAVHRLCFCGEADLAKKVLARMPASVMEAPTGAADAHYVYREALVPWNTNRTNAVEFFRPGLYRHYAGGLYTALGLVTHHETRRPMVKYVSHTYGGENVRPLLGWEGDPDGFMDLLLVEDSDGHADNMTHVKKTLRFTRLGDLPSDIPITER